MNNTVNVPRGLQRVAAGEVRLVHVPDLVNHSDYLTKLVGSKKTASCDRYATNSRNEVPLDGERGVAA